MYVHVRVWTSMLPLRLSNFAWFFFFLLGEVREWFISTMALGNILHVAKTGEISGRFTWLVTGFSSTSVFLRLSVSQSLHMERLDGSRSRALNRRIHKYIDRQIDTRKT